MNHGPLLFLGVFFSMAMSFGGMILGPHFKIGHQQQVANELNGGLYPPARMGLAQEGAGVYRSLGCAECHTEQVRGVGTDRARGWGPRITVAQDYLGDYPVLLGKLRVGPDLANIGLRQPDSASLLLHLYAPQKAAPGSIMPPYRFLFAKRPIKPGHIASRNALPVAGLKPNEEIVPTHKAEALVAYLQSLTATVPLFEAPLPPSARPPVAAGTNAASTNASAVSNQPPATSAPVAVPSP